MKIIYLHQHFRKPDEWGSTRPYHLASAMAAAGHEVHIICGHNASKKKAESINGFTVHYPPAKYEQGYGVIKRGWVFLKFAYRAYKEAKEIINVKSKTQNVKLKTLVYASSTPLTVGITALMLKKYTSVPFIFEVRDLWPEAPIEMGIIKNAYIIKQLHNLAKKIYKNASAIISLSPGISEGIRKYEYDAPLYELSNFSDTELFKPEITDEFLRTKYLKPGEKGVIYFGALGVANHLEYMLDIAEKAKEIPLHFFIVGDGSEKEKLMQIANSKKLDNVTFLPPLPKNELPALLSIMDFSYISFLNLPVLTTCSPNKLFDSLAAGKICITNTRGWMKDLLEKEECGFYANPEKPEEFIDKITALLHDENNMKVLKNNARRIAEEKYSERVICDKVVEVINSMEI